MGINSSEHRIGKGCGRGGSEKTQIVKTSPVIEEEKLSEEVEQVRRQSVR